jgi:hypothetical protein
MDDDLTPWTADEAGKLGAFPAPLARTRYRDNPAQFAAEHQREGCRVWKAGVGSVVPGFVSSPAQRLIDEEDSNV